MINIPSSFSFIAEQDTLFDMMFPYQKMLKSCTDKCDQIVHDDKDYQEKVRLCRLKCKIHITKQVIISFRKSEIANPQRKPIIDKQINYLSMRQKQYIIQHNIARRQLMARLQHVPAAMSMRPAKERPEADRN